MSIFVISNHNSCRVLFDKIASLYFIRKIYLYFSIGNGQPMEPALCQLYRHRFVRYSTPVRHGATDRSSTSGRGTHGRRQFHVSAAAAAVDDYLSARLCRVAIHHAARGAVLSAAFSAPMSPLTAFSLCTPTAGDVRNVHPLYGQRDTRKHTDIAHPLPGSARVESRLPELSPAESLSACALFPSPMRDHVKMTNRKHILYCCQRRQPRRKQFESGGAHGERGARAYKGVWGRSPQPGPGAEPLVRGSGGRSPPEA